MTYKIKKKNKKLTVVGKVFKGIGDVYKAGKEADKEKKKKEEIPEDINLSDLMKYP